MTISFFWVLSREEPFSSTWRGISTKMTGQPDHQTHGLGTRKNTNFEILWRSDDLGLVSSVIQESFSDEVLCLSQNALLYPIWLSSISSKSWMGVIWIGSRCVNYMSRHMLDKPFNAQTFVGRHRTLRLNTWKTCHLGTPHHAPTMFPVLLLWKQVRHGGVPFSKHGTWGQATGILTHFRLLALLLCLPFDDVHRELQRLTRNKRCHREKKATGDPKKGKRLD